MTTATEVRERPIPFTGELVRAILDGRKTVTRRVVKPQPGSQWSIPPAMFDKGYLNRFGCQRGDDSIQCPYVVGDRLWVKETWRCVGAYPDNGQVHIEWRAGGSDHRRIEDWARYLGDKHHWRGGRFMPRWAARLFLEITSRRVERLQDISEKEARDEGVDESFRTVIADPRGYPDYSLPIGYRAGFCNVWEKLNGKTHPWQSNPWVWVVRFKVIAPARGEGEERDGR